MYITRTTTRIIDYRQSYEPQTIATSNIAIKGESILSECIGFQKLDINY